jgi:hypothetical protein
MRNRQIPATANRFGRQTLGTFTRLCDDPIVDRNPGPNVQGYQVRAFIGCLLGIGRRRDFDS